MVKSMFDVLGNQNDVEQEVKVNSIRAIGATVASLYSHLTSAMIRSSVDSGLIDKL